MRFYRCPITLIAPDSTGDAAELTINVQRHYSCINVTRGSPTCEVGDGVLRHNGF